MPGGVKCTHWAPVPPLTSSKKKRSCGMRSVASSPMNEAELVHVATVTVDRGEHVFNDSSSAPLSIIVPAKPVSSSVPQNTSSCWHGGDRSSSESC